MTRREKVSWAIIENAFYLSTITLEERVLIHSWMSADDQLRCRHNTAILDMLRRMYQGIKWIIPFVRTQEELIEYASDVFDRTDEAIGCVKQCSNQDQSIEGIKVLRADVEDFFSPYLSKTPKELLAEAKKINGYCTSLNSLSLKLKDQGERLKVLEESASTGNYWANDTIWKLFRNKGGSREMVSLYRMCAIASVLSYREMKIAIQLHPKYKESIIEAMSYGMQMMDYTGVPKVDWWELPNGIERAYPKTLYGGVSGCHKSSFSDCRNRGDYCKNRATICCSHHYLYGFMMNRYIQLKSEKEIDYYKHDDIEIRLD